MLTAAGVAAATSADTTWEDLIAARVFEPLGMTRTSALEADFYAADNRAVIHVIADGVATPRYQRHPDAQSPAGGMSSTVRDMANWMVLQLNDGRFEGKQVVDAAALATTHQPQIVRGRGRDGRATFYGLGYNVDYGADGLVRVSHAGAFFTGARTDVTFLPDRSSASSCSPTPSRPARPKPSPTPSSIRSTSGRRSEDYLAAYEPIFAAMLETPDIPRPPIRSRPCRPRPMPGTYANDYYGNAEVAEGEGGALVLMLGPASGRSRCATSTAMPSPLSSSASATRGRARCSPRSARRTAPPPPASPSTSSTPTARAPSPAPPAP